MTTKHSAMEPAAIIGGDWRIVWLSPLGTQSLKGASVGDKLYREADLLKERELREDAELELVDLQTSHENTRHNCSAFEDAMGDLQVRNGSLEDRCLTLEHRAQEIATEKIAVEKQMQGYLDVIETLKASAAKWQRKCEESEAELKTAQVEYENGIAAWCAAYEYAFARDTEDGESFFRLWHEGDFEAVRENWPDAPWQIHLGDPAFVPPEEDG